ncbi:hypothetical protein FE246_03855 [Aliarcobacter thereius]|uniref:Uncharacterized protein n=1 Tax=Aliarcobacter thereius TaxID=544718 RepID=A0A5R9H071_9BACT|nr:hypothetical protein [Aliarcobacter thereius]TLS72531.1 hypothetical protein FE246_03855 [Aliarcobacter thereius]
MLPVLPFIIGGALGTVAGVVAKKIYDENEDEIHQALEDKIAKVDEWLDEKLVALDNYLDSLDDDMIDFVKFYDTKKSVYKDSFLSFANYFNSLENTNLDIFDIKDMKIFETKIIDENSNQDETIIYDYIEKLESYNEVLNSILKALLNDKDKKLDFTQFSDKKRALVNEAYSLAKEIESICLEK